MDDYLMRTVTPEDFSFLADVIIGAEKGNSGKLSYATLFGMEENSVKELIIAMLNEDIDGCEFSPSSYLIADYKGEPVAALGAWIECFNQALPSKILKSNLLSFFLEKKKIQSLNSKLHILRDIVIEREVMSLQLEYLYVARMHRGRELHTRLLNEHVVNAFLLFPELCKAQAQVFENNSVAIKAYEKVGFGIVKTYRSGNDEIFDYLPYNAKTLMEKNLN